MKRRIRRNETPTADAIRAAVEAEVVDRIAEAVRVKDEHIAHLEAAISDLQSDLRVAEARLHSYRDRIQDLLDGRDKN